MGLGRWNERTYDAARIYRERNGIDDFAYSEQTRRLDPRLWRVAPELDPRNAVRESRDSTEHPESTPIAVWFDVTGSMGRVPRMLQQSLKELLGRLLEERIVTDPQIMFGAIGDAETDRVPLQVGQFESDNRMDDQLRAIFLEGGGGGQKTESYELVAWFMHNRVWTDANEVRRRKGYLFIIGDEMNKPFLKGSHLREVFDEERFHDARLDELYPAVAEKWHTYFVLPRMTSYFNDPEIEEHWRPLVGERFLRLEEPTEIASFIASVIAANEGVRSGWYGPSTF